MNVNPYLIFDGDCEAALTFYAQATGGTRGPMMRFGQTEGGGDLPASHRERIMHSYLAFGQTVLMASDNHPDHPYRGVNGCSVALAVDSVADAERVFAALSAGGQVTLPLATTFWAARFGMLVDRFGVPWMVNCEREA